MSDGPTVLVLAKETRRLESEATHSRDLLREAMREAQSAGASIAQLMEWTGYSRRTIFYMLKENTK